MQAGALERRAARAAPTIRARRGPRPSRPGSGCTRALWAMRQPYWTRPESIPSSSSSSTRSSPWAARWSASISSWVASMRRAEWARYQANSTPGVPAVARSQSISTSRSPSKPRLSPRRSPWISVGAPCARSSASASASGLARRARARRPPRRPGRARAKASHPCSNCFGSRSGCGRSASATAGEDMPMRSLSEAAPGGHAVAERAVELRGGGEDAPALLAREPHVRRKQLGAERRASRSTRRRPSARPRRCRGRSTPASRRTRRRGRAAPCVRGRPSRARASRSRPALTRFSTNAVPSSRCARTQRRARVAAVAERRRPAWRRARSRSAGGGATASAAARPCSGAPRCSTARPPARPAPVRTYQRRRSGPLAPSHSKLSATPVSHSCASQSAIVARARTRPRWATIASAPSILRRPVSLLVSSTASGWRCSRTRDQSPLSIASRRRSAKPAAIL